MIFVSENKKRFIFQHLQDCCESVYIEDICGDLDDLIGSPLIEAQQVSNINNMADLLHDGIIAESYTWTFYRFSTVKGTVVVRWLGTSNGCYSEEVSYSEEDCT